MKVYGVYSGCIYEGGGVSAMYANKDRAVKECGLMVRRLQREHANCFKLNDPEHYKAYKWKKDNKYSDTYWSNTVECVMLQEFDIIE